MEALEAQGYMETVCYKCPSWGDCQGSNIEDCMRRDAENAEAAVTEDYDPFIDPEEFEHA